MKGVSEFVVVLLILIILMSSLSVLWLFYHNMFSAVTTSSATSSIGSALSSCMNIDSANGNKIYLRNCGNGLVTNDTLNVFIDDAPFSYSMTPASIGEGGVAEITISGLWKISPGNHKLRITTKDGEVERYVKNVLPDSCVMDLEFDENSGSIAYDGSGYSNNGTLINFPNVSWSSNCKFGNCLNFNGSNGYVNVINGPSLTINSNFSVSFWVYVSSIQGSCTSIIGKPTAGGANTFLIYNALSGVGCGSGTSSTTSIVFKWYDTTGGLHDGSPSSSAISTNVWHFITLEFNSGTSTMFIDGTYNAQSVISATMTNVNGALKIGYGDSYFNGTIDSVRVYNNALSPDGTVSFKLGELA